MSTRALGGQFIRDSEGNVTHYEGPHEELVRHALYSRKGASADTSIHMRDEQIGAPQPMSGNGKIMRAAAKALITEIGTNARSNDRPLYRGSNSPNTGIQEWSERRAVANLWAKRSGGTVEKLPRGTAQGIRIGDYIDSQIDSGERGWMIDRRNG